jgi:hypothetical protein
MRGDGVNSDVREVAGNQELQELQEFRSYRIRNRNPALGSDFLESGRGKAKPFSV